MEDAAAGKPGQRFLGDIQAVAEAPDERAFLTTLASRGRALLGVGRATVWLWEPQHRWYRLAAAEPPDQPVGLGSTITPETFPALRVGYRTFAPVVVEDAEGSDLVPRLAANLLQVRSVMAAPVAAGRRPLGFITFDDPGRRRAFSEADVRLASALGALAAAKLSHFEADRVLRRALARERLLREVARHVEEAPLALRVRLQRLARGAVEALGAEHAVLFLTAPDGQHLADVLTAGVSPGGVRVLRGLVGTPLEDLPRTRDLLEGRTVVVDDVDRAPDLELPRRLGVRSLLAAPIHARPVGVGALAVAYTSRRHTFTEEEVALAEDLGRIGGLAVRSASLYEAAVERERLRAQLLRRATEAQELERRVLAGELVDAVLEPQLLGTSLLQLAELALRAHDLPTAARRLQEARAQLAQAEGAVRRVAASLRAPALEAEELLPALWELARPLREAGLLVQVEGALPKLDPAVAATAYRVVEEAFSNVRRHARATRVSVVAWVRDGVLTVEVSDDGTGFQASPPAELVRRGHFGLTLIHERAAFAGGEVSVASRPGRGTTVRLRLPVRVGAAAAPREAVPA